MKPRYKQQSAHKMSLATNLNLKASESEVCDLLLMRNIYASPDGTTIR